MCTERSSVIHNCWLLLGEKSCWVNSDDFYMDNNQAMGHAFSIVSIDMESEGKMKKSTCLHDVSLSVWAKVDDDIIEKLKNGEILEVPKDQKTTVVYVGACKRNNYNQ